MLYCQLTTEEQNGGEYRSIGKVSHLLHGLLDSGRGMAWCRLELLAQFEPADETSQAAYRARLPEVGMVVNELQLSGDPDFNPDHLTRHFANNSGYPNPAENKHSLICKSVKSLAFNFRNNQWFRGVYLAVEFTPVHTGADFSVGSNGEIRTWNPSLGVSNLNAATCVHGQKLLFGNQQQEFVYDLYDEQYDGAPQRVLRYEKHSSRVNSVLHWALAEAVNNIRLTTGPGLGANLQYFQPRNPASPQGRQAPDAQDAQIIAIQCGGSGGNLERLHFLECSGHFKGLQLPSLAEFRDPASDILRKPDYFERSLNDILEAEPDVRGAGEIPHEIVTLVLR